MRRSGAVLVITGVVAALLVGASPAVAAPRTVVVAAHGSDAADGTVAHPLRTVEAAVRRLGPGGGTVALRGGVYHRRFALHDVRDVTVRPWEREHVVLSGAGLTVPAGRSAMVDVSDSTGVTVRDLEITGLRTTDIDAVPIGVLVHGHDEGVTLAGLHVHHLGNDNRTRGSFDINAHGIAVYGDDPHASIHDLRIDGNRVDHLVLGASESVVVNGNVEHWSISRNRIGSNNNIGIDAIGFEPTLTGRFRYTEANRARDGVIAGNTVSRIRSQGNPSYAEDGGYCGCADGIYVDGGERIRITGNRVDGNDIGIEVAAENARGDARDVLVDHNLVTGSLFTGITTGGYCDGGEDCGGVQTGASLRNVFTGNVLRGNNRLDDGSPELLVQYHAHGDRFERNSITATDAAHAVLGTVARSDSTGNTSDHNVFRAVGGTARTADFGWAGRTFTGFGPYRAATGQDRHSVFR